MNKSGPRGKTAHTFIINSETMDQLKKMAAAQQSYQMADAMLKARQ